MTLKRILAFKLGMYAFTLASGCVPAHKNQEDGGSQLSSFTVYELESPAGSPEWASSLVAMQRLDGDKKLFSRNILRNAFKNGIAEDLTITVPQAQYNIHLVYKDSTGKIVFQTCPDARDKAYAVITEKFETEIPVCAENSSEPVAVVPVVPSSSVEIRPKIKGKVPDATGEASKLCIQPNYGLPTSPAAATRIQYDVMTGPLNLPNLAVTASNIEIKNFVKSVYDSLPIFKQVFEVELGLTRRQALAFIFADMSRESAQGERWRIDLETGQGGPGHAWGPLQAAVTNFTGGGYDNDILKFSGLPVPVMADFRKPAVSTYAGMKRLIEGILKSIRDFGKGQPARLYLLGTLADHNTGHPVSAKDADWLKSYGDEVLRLMQGYLYGDNLNNDRAFWTTQPDEQICR